jgi:hypothetical protein
VTRLWDVPRGKRVRFRGEIWEVMGSTAAANWIELLSASGVRREFPGGQPVEVCVEVVSGHTAPTVGG